MADYTVTLSAEQEKALLSNVISIHEWIDNAIQNKARQMIDRHVTESGLGSKRTPLERKLEIIRDMEIETALERQAREEQKMAEIPQ
jgi:hypothetical protein|tara:strand:+ start:641 stop:901 length:261 start_codon:yes stop_codon:yes gene_type:complete